jgi:MoCo/4Fe-4S cofactor protein with predicted Tat translocation signal
MKEGKKVYWQGLEQLNQDPEFLKNAEKEFPEYLPIKEQNIGKEGKGERGLGSDRRDFLKLMGFSVAAASLAACEAPVRKAIPYLNKPENIDPGVANYFASTYSQDGDYCSILVKTREGRPIFIQGNKLSPVTGGSINSRVVASVLDLYNKDRLKDPKVKGDIAEWKKVDLDITKKLSSITASGGKIALVTKTISSPSTLKLISEIQKAYPGLEHVVYDVNSCYGIRKGNEMTFGMEVLPAYDFSKAKTIVSIGSDFLGSWVSPIEFSRQYSMGRKVSTAKRKMSRHYQYEALLSLTGANADYRTKIKASEDSEVVKSLYNLIAASGLGNTIPGGEKQYDNLNQAAKELIKNRGKCLVVSGSNDPNVQALVNGINYMLQNYGQTIDPSKGNNTRQGDDKKMAKFANGMAGGEYKGVVFFNCNPVYDHPLGDKIADGIKKTLLSISTSMVEDETAALVQYLCPGHHYLESWNDSMPRSGSFSLTQPTISPLFNTRQAEESLLRFAGRDITYYDYVRSYWKENVHNNGSSFGTFWDRSLHDGVFEQNSPSEDGANMVPEFLSESIQTAASNIAGGGEGLELVLYEKINIGSGEQANNPWLQECPDPITKVCWDNYVSISIPDSKEMGIQQDQMVKVSANGKSLTLPALIQPAQQKGVIAVSYGYGREKAGKVGNGVGADVYAMADTSRYLNYTISKGVSLEKVGGKRVLAQTQTHHTYMGRDYVVQETTLKEFKKDAWAGRYQPIVNTYEGKKAPAQISLWKGHKYPNHHWGLVVDLNSCTGCSACIVSCNSENNIPVVGREEVINRREMHWMRVDRYYSSDEDGFKTAEIPSDNPEIVFQPLMCQQCNNAPCETVCPVSATTHSTEGLNQMVYNRCIGTRYCANNCPYKVRRFNWFKYHDNTRFPNNSAMNNDLGKMVLNPDVTVRSRGVMEKCTFCVQRIQAGKLEARKEGRKVKDGDIQTACTAACPTDALVFGDMKDPKSRISFILGEENKERSFHALEEINIKPNVTYLAKVRNKEISNQA